MANTSILAAFERMWLHVVAALSNKSDSDHTHSEATQAEAGLLSAADKIQLDYGGVPIVTTSGDGATYTATVDGMTTLTVGMTLIIIPHTVSTSAAPKLNVNSLGEKVIRRRVTNSTTSTSTGYNASWLAANKPIRVEYDGTFWIADLPKPSAADMSGTLGVSNGGTGKSSVTAGSFLVGNGASAMTEMTAEEVLSYINGASVMTLSTEEYNALETTNANTLYVLTDGEEGESSSSGSSLPTVTTDDNGKFLRVVDGAWAAATISYAEEASF